MREMKTIDNLFDKVPSKEFVTLVHKIGELLGVANGNIHYQEQLISNACKKTEYKPKTDDEIRCYCLGEADVPKTVYACAVGVLERAARGEIKIEDKNLKSGKASDMFEPFMYDYHETYEIGQRMILGSTVAMVVEKLPRDRIMVRYGKNTMKVLYENVMDYKPQDRYEKGQRIKTEFGIATVIEILPHNMMKVRHQDRKSMILLMNVAEEDLHYSRDESPYLQAHRVDL